jgi:uncharacterized protein
MPKAEGLVETMTLLIPGFFLAALAYAGAGFGGGSSYIALLVLWGWKTESLVTTALACNLFVAGQGTAIFGFKGCLKSRTASPFLAASIPMSFLGGVFQVRKEIWLMVLGSFLILSGAALLSRKRNEGRALACVGSEVLWPVGLGLGGGLGFLAGLVGIGGGIFLSPILHFLGIGKGREIAALSALFILMNSASGLAGQVMKSGFPQPMGPGLALCAAVLVGGHIGSRWAADLLSNSTLRYWTAALVVSAGIRILWGVF